MVPHSSDPFLSHCRSKQNRSSSSSSSPVKQEDNPSLYLSVCLLGGNVRAVTRFLQFLYILKIPKNRWSGKTSARQLQCRTSEKRRNVVLKKRRVEMKNDSPIRSFIFYNDT